MDCSDCDELKREVERLRQDMETAWCIIANAYDGDWDKAQPRWKDAAKRWRDEAWNRIASQSGIATTDWDTVLLSPVNGA
jgi:hypothetical protein